MIKINLLDWRQAQRERRQKSFLGALAGSAVLGLAIVIAMIAKINADIEYQQQRNNRLSQEIRTLDKKIAEIAKLDKVKQDLLARMRIIEELQQSRTQIVHFFDQVVATVPAGLYLEELKQTGASTQVKGISESNGRVSTYIRNLDGSDWFANSSLVVIKAKDKDRRRYSEFTLNFKSVKPKAQEVTE